MRFGLVRCHQLDGWRIGRAPSWRGCGVRSGPRLGFPLAPTPCPSWRVYGALGRGVPIVTVNGNLLPPTLECRDRRGGVALSALGVGRCAAVALARLPPGGSPGDRPENRHLGRKCRPRSVFEGCGSRGVWIGGVLVHLQPVALTGVATTQTCLDHPIAPPNNPPRNPWTALPPLLGVKSWDN